MIHILSQMQLDLSIAMRGECCEARKTPKNKSIVECNKKVLSEGTFWPKKLLAQLNFNSTLILIKENVNAKWSGSKLN